MAGLKNAFLLTILKSICGLTGVLLAIFMAQTFLGRRVMMLTGHFTATFFMAGVAIAGTVAPGTEEAGKAITACLLMYYFFYNGFSGALSWSVASELVSSRLRVLTIGTGTGVHYTFACKSPRK
jgi:hypothetical protein